MRTLNKNIRISIIIVFILSIVILLLPIITVFSLHTNSDDFNSDLDSSINEMSLDSIDKFFNKTDLSISGTPYLNNPVNLTLTVVTSNGSGLGHEIISRRSTK